MVNISVTTNEALLILMMLETKKKSPVALILAEKVAKALKKTKNGRALLRRK